MKMYDIMMYLFIFNMFFWLISSGLSLYNIGFTTESEFNLTSESNNPTEIGWGIIDTFGMFGAFGTISLVIAAIVAGAVIGSFLPIPSSQSIVYGLFIVFFWNSTLKTFTVFINMLQDYPGGMFLFVIFAMIVGVIFVTGLFQMVTGGWKSFK